MKKIVLIGMMILSSLLLWGQKNDKVCLSGSVKGFIETPLVICDFSMEGVEPDTLEIASDGSFSFVFITIEQPKLIRNIRV